MRYKRVLLAAILGVAILFLPSPVFALTINTSRDCDDNAVLHCGALSTSEVQSKYKNDPTAITIFHNFGITHNDINALDSTAVEGKVTQGGRVIVNNETVATNAMTVGRQNMKGSTTTTNNGVTYYVRPPSASFEQSSLPAFVVLKNNQFAFAIIASCGNPVKATPVAKKTTTQSTQPAPTPPPVAATPVPQQTQKVTVVQGVSTTAPSPTPVPQPTPPPPQQLPNTGVGDVMGLGALIAIPSSIAHYIYKRRNLMG